MKIDMYKFVKECFIPHGNQYASIISVFNVVLRNIVYFIVRNTELHFVSK